MSRPSEYPYLNIILEHAERVAQLEAQNAGLKAENAQLLHELTEIRATCGVIANYLHGKAPLTIVDSLWKVARRG